MMASPPPTSTLPLWERVAAIGAFLGSLLCLALVVEWARVYMGGGGFGYSSDKKEVGLLFNWHPVCMVLGLVLCFTWAVLSYRFLPFLSRAAQKRIHLGLQTAAFILMIFGLRAVFVFHNVMGFPNMYSMHSWIGIATALLFSVQYVMGVYHFWFPKSPDATRAAFVPVHAAAGIFLFMMVVITAVSGVMEKATFSGDCGKCLAKGISASDKEKFCGSCRVSNTLGVALVGTALAVFWAIVPKRQVVQHGEADKLLH